jgi:hypothetical protein
MIVLIVYDEKNGWQWSVTNKTTHRTSMGTAANLNDCFEIIDSLGILSYKIKSWNATIEIKGEDDAG